MAGLRDELLAIDGVDGAEIAGDEDHPEGVRLRLGAGADPDAVGAAVRDLLDGRGIRSRMDAAGRPVASPPPPPGAGAAVVALPSSPPPDPLVEIHRTAEGTKPLDPTGAAVFVGTSGVGDPGLLRRVAVEEGPDGLEVVVVTGAGREVRRASRSEPAAIDQALVEAVAAAVGVSPRPALLAIEERRMGDREVLVVVLGLGEGALAGAAIRSGTRAYTLARAAWAALGGISRR